jgi:hypothetical protein
MLPRAAVSDSKEALGPGRCGLRSEYQSASAGRGISELVVVDRAYAMPVGIAVDPDDQ